MKYVLFARLNQGSMSLNAQELRNCLFRGPYNNLIAELSESRDFLTLWGRREPDQRMRQREMILRMFALIHRRDRYRTPFRAFLNDEMADHRDLGDGTESRFRDEFTNAIRWIDRIFGTESLRLFRMGNGDEPSGRWIRRRYDLVYEVEAVGFGSLGSKLNQIYDSIDYRDQRAFCTSMRSRLVTVMTKEQFVETLREGTTRPNVLRRRFELWLGPLHQAITDPDAFIRRGHELLECLNNPVCTKCPQPVAVDDAVLKSTGTRLAIEHRYCGSSKN
jgi:hypothetical protein